MFSFLFLSFFSFFIYFFLSLLSLHPTHSTYPLPTSFSYTASPPSCLPPQLLFFIFFSLLFLGSLLLYLLSYHVTPKKTKPMGDAHWRVSHLSSSLSLLPSSTLPFPKTLTATRSQSSFILLLLLLLLFYVFFPFSLFLFFSTPLPIFSSLRCHCQWHDLGTVFGAPSIPFLLFFPPIFIITFLSFYFILFLFFKMPSTLIAAGEITD